MFIDTPHSLWGDPAVVASTSLAFHVGLAATPASVDSVGVYVSVGGGQGYGFIVGNSLICVLGCDKVLLLLHN